MTKAERSQTPDAYHVWQKEKQNTISWYTTKIKSERESQANVICSIYKPVFCAPWKQIKKSADGRDDFLCDMFSIALGYTRLLQQ